MKEDELEFLKKLHDENFEVEFDAWIGSIEEAFLQGEFAPFCNSISMSMNE